jgi:hypothetical protein
MNLTVKNPRVVKLIRNAISTLKLDLTGLTVLTEGASGWYVLTPIIAALAGAKNVLAMTRETRYGSVAEIQKQTFEMAEFTKCAGRIRVLTDRDDISIADADIVTNLGMIRPLDITFLRKLKPTAVIPLMWETWEFRPEDLDLNGCLALGIPVLGTNEHHTDIDIFPYVGHLALKLAFEAGIEIWRSRFVIAGHGEFALLAKKSLESAGASVVFADTQTSDALLDTAFIAALKDADALVVVDHHHRKIILNDTSPLSSGSLALINPSISVLHISGGVDRQSLVNQGLACWPGRFAPAGYMSVATDYLGPRPLIDLHTAGLKVGEEMARNRLDGKSATQIMETLPSVFSLAQGFKNL